MTSRPRDSHTAHSSATIEDVALWLETLGAQRDVVTYAEAFGTERGRFWAECPRGDWLLAIAVRMKAPRDAIAQATLDVLSLALDHLPDDDVLSHEVLRAARAQLSGDAGLARSGLREPGPSETDLEALEASTLSAPDPAVSLARQAISLACRALAQGGALEDVALVPALLAQAAAFDAGDCAMIAAASYVQHKSADLVRARLTLPCSISAGAEP